MREAKKRSPIKIDGKKKLTDGNPSGETKNGLLAVSSMFQKGGAPQKVHSHFLPDAHLQFKDCSKLLLTNPFFVVTPISRCILAT